MKILTQGKELSLVSENESERTALAVFFATNSAKSAEVTVTEKPPRKHRKKHAHKKTCGICFRTFKGAQGLGRHSVVHKRSVPSSHEGMTRIPVTAG